MQLLKSTVRSIANTPVAEDVQVDLSHSVEDAQVEMDFDLLPAVFTNIIKNATEAIEGYRSPSAKRA